MRVAAATSLQCKPDRHYSHVLIDEAQDTSEAQLALLRLLAPRDQSVVTAVGDFWLIVGLLGRSDMAEGD